MKKKTYNEEKFLKKLKRDAVFSGITSIIIGVMTIAVFLVFAIDSRELAFMIFGLVLGSVFIASGIYFFRRPGIIEKRNRELLLNRLPRTLVEFIKRNRQNLKLEEKRY